MGLISFYRKQTRKRNTEMTTKYYAVRADKKSWTKDATTIEDFTKRGYRVQKSRLNGDFDVFSADGIHKVATLFASKLEAARFVSE
jgi:hypothetical protein